MDRHRNTGVCTDTLFVGMTRPPLLLGVPYAAMLVNVVLTMEAFIATRNVLWLLCALPIHGVFYLLCLYEPQFFDLFRVWGLTRGLALLRGTVAFWKSGSYSALRLDLPASSPRRTAAPPVVF